jgi:hypothetical protein
LSDLLENNSLGETICAIDLSPGASFLSNSQRVHNKDLPAILNSFAESILYRNVQYMADHHLIYKALPIMLVNFANGSHVDSGF